MKYLPLAEWALTHDLFIFRRFVMTVVTKTVSDEQLGIVARRMHDLFERVRTGGVGLGFALNGLQALAENKGFTGEQSLGETLSLGKLKRWLKEKGLEKFLSGHSLEKQIRDQERFYRQFYGPDFCLDRKKIRIDVNRLPAIKAGLEAGCLNYALLKVVPDNPDKAEASMTEALFFYERILAPFKKDGLRIWAEVGAERWTKLTLKEFLSLSNPIEPEDFNPEAMREDWVKEVTRVVTAQGEVPRIIPGSVELVFTSNLPNIPSDQRIVNKAGEIVEPKDRSYISAITDQVRVISRAEGIILAAQLYWQDKTYLARNTWEWLRDVASHPAVNPPVSVGLAHSFVGELSLHSDYADNLDGSHRLRLSL